MLNTIPGVQLQQNANRTPGGDGTDFFLQGAAAGIGQVLVLIDGIQLNNYTQGWADVFAVSVQQIERVEIVKGAASAAWGAALGGVVNIVTKSPDPEKRLGGQVSASYGERSTSDSRGELTGTVGSFGYYLSGGKITSQGLLPNNGVDNNNGYFKFSYALPRRGSVTLGGSIWETRNGDDGPYSPTGIAHDYNKSTYGYSFLNITQPLADQLTLEITGKGRYLEKTGAWGERWPDGSVTFQPATFDRESSWGGGTKLIWGDNRNGVATGFDYERGNLSTNSGADKYQFDRYGFYANGLLSVGPVTLIPGIRYDNTGIAGNFTSYTLGAIWQLTDKTLLRVYGARGYGLPSLDANHYDKTPQQVWTVQTGVETSEIPYLWLKGTLFYNRLKNAFASDPSAPQLSRQTKQGFEVEARTVAWYGLSFTGGYTFNDSRDDNNDRQKNEPWHIGKLGLLYDNNDLGLRGTVTGSYVWWESDYFGAKSNTILWDLHLNQKLFSGKDCSPELFFSVRNLFNASQRFTGIYENAPRWLEGGVRFRF